MILLLFSTIFSLGYFGFLILMTLFSWMGFANLVRAEFLRLRNSGFVMAKTRKDFIFHKVGDTQINKFILNQ